ncbi:hypothetical protein HW130_00390 [Streptomyces sp. PKU-EA00015]|uniref:hypothetical protein n=1 Tax=Streptomyces sp. PKU-EA00015 TaxID=2748326 RepID=UPI0015A41505|nr:hypothetical protein [Streptomyces sp. PKU-EA00015]NWF24740.1 hypothetical protein [Streptomyces sp. PKU-EA00015]
MNQDETLAAALHEAAEGVPVGTAPTAAVMRQGKMIRRRHKAMRSAVVAAAVLVPAVGVAFSATFDSSPRPQVPAASAAVKVVDPGEKVMLGRGKTMWLSDQGMFLATPNASGSAKERLMEVAEVPGGKISATAAGDDAGTVWAGIYRGPEKPTRVTFSLEGRTMNARIVTLPGRPGWVAFHADDTHARKNDITITVQGADGAILASLAKPGMG